MGQFQGGPRSVGRGASLERVDARVVDLLVWADKLSRGDDPVCPLCGSDATLHNPPRPDPANGFENKPIARGLRKIGIIDKIDVFRGRQCRPPWRFAWYFEPWTAAMKFFGN